MQASASLDIGRVVFMSAKFESWFAPLCQVHSQPCISTHYGLFSPFYGMAALVFAKIALLYGLLIAFALLPWPVLLGAVNSWYALIENSQ